MPKRHFRHKIPQKKKPKKALKKEEKKEQKFFHHDLYGDIPLIQIWLRDSQGTPYASDSYRPDPTYKPRLPPGAIPANVELQRYYLFFGCPKYFYVDENHTCVQCGTVFVFSAEDQQYWYESIQFSVNAHPYRCPACREQKKSARLVIERVGKAKELVKHYPDNPVANLQLAEAICAQFLMYGVGKLEQAIAAARKSFKRDPECVEALFYEALAEQLRKRPAVAISLFERFLQMAGSLPRCSKLCTYARSQLKILLQEKDTTRQGNDSPISS